MSFLALDSCDWSAPGADRYTGTASAAIHAFATIPEPVRQRLVAKHERRAWDDVVYIDRDAIRGRKEAWDPGIRDMHFGSRGRVCGRVDRSKWTASHVESAVVYCDSGYCVAWPSVCGNWFVIAPQATERRAMLATAAEAIAPADVLDGADDAAGDADDGPVFGAPGTQEPLAGGGDGPVAAFGASFGTAATVSGAASVGSFAARAIARTTSAPTAAAVVTPIPEPSTWAGLLGGLAMLGALARRRTHRRSLSRR